MSMYPVAYDVPSMTLTYHFIRPVRRATPTGCRRAQLDGIDINIGDTWCHRVIYVLEQRDSMVSDEGRNLPILITS